MLIKIFEKDMAVSFSELFTNKLNWRIFWNINAVFLLYFLMRWLYYINFQADKLSTYPNIKTFLIQFVNSFWLTSNQAGFPEEMVFRAWIQNSLMSKIKIKNAIILSNILFVIIHIPSFILYYKYTNFWSCFYHSIGVFVFGSIFGILFAKTKNILAPVFFHTILDVFAVMVLKS
jgi:membrane protease YdiL (CAAX protease family)